MNTLTLLSISEQCMSISISSISAALSCLVCVPPREEPSGEERGLLSRTAAGDRAYISINEKTLLDIYKITKTLRAFSLVDRCA